MSNQKNTPIIEQLSGLPRVLAGAICAVGSVALVGFAAVWGQEAASLAGYTTAGFGHGIILLRFAVHWCIAMPAICGLFAGLPNSKNSALPALGIALALLILSAIGMERLIGFYTLIFSVLGALLLVPLYAFGKLVGSYCYKTKLVETGVSCALFYSLPSVCSFLIWPGTHTDFRADTLLSLVGLFMANVCFVRFAKLERVSQVSLSTLFVCFPLLCAHLVSLTGDVATCLLSPRSSSACESLVFDAAGFAFIWFIAFSGAMTGFVSTKVSSLWQQRTVN